MYICVTVYVLIYLCTCICMVSFVFNYTTSFSPQWQDEQVKGNYNWQAISPCAGWTPSIVPQKLIHNSLVIRQRVCNLVRANESHLFPWLIFFLSFIKGSSGLIFSSLRIERKKRNIWLVPIDLETSFTRNVHVSVCECVCIFTPRYANQLKRIEGAHNFLLTFNDNYSAFFILFSGFTFLHSD